MLFGVDRDAMPSSWPEFERFWAGILRSDELEVPAEGHDRLGPFLDQSILPFVSRWLVRWLMVMQLNTLPDAFRAQFEAITPHAKARPRFTAASVALLRTLLRVAPAGLTGAPRVMAARRRATAVNSTRALERRMARALPHPFGERQPSMTRPATPAADPENSAALKLSAV
jgi:uncharacterized protein (DUF2236 family)